MGGGAMAWWLWFWNWEAFLILEVDHDLAPLFNLFPIWIWWPWMFEKRALSSGSAIGLYKSLGLTKAFCPNPAICFYLIIWLLSLFSIHFWFMDGITCCYDFIFAAAE